MPVCDLSLGMFIKAWIAVRSLETLFWLYNFTCNENENPLFKGNKFTTGIRRYFVEIGETWKVVDADVSHKMAIFNISFLIMEKIHCSC